MQLLIESGAIMDYRLDSSGPFARNTVNSAPNVSGDGTNVFNSSWFTPLHVAAFENKIDSLKVIINRLCCIIII
jgi:hypothetical protein